MGWQAARARVRKCGRRPKPTPEQAVHSEERYGAGNCTVQQIADLKTTVTVQVPRATDWRRWWGSRVDR